MHRNNTRKGWQPDPDTLRAMAAQELAWTTEADGNVGDAHKNVEAARDCIISAETAPDGTRYERRESGAFRAVGPLLRVER